MAAAGFLSHYLNDHLPYVRCYITVNKNVLSVSLNETFRPYAAKEIFVTVMQFDSYLKKTPEMKFIRDMYLLTTDMVLSFRVRFIFLEITITTKHQ